MEISPTCMATVTHSPPTCLLITCYVQRNVPAADQEEATYLVYTYKRKMKIEFKTLRNSGIRGKSHTI